MELPDDTPRLPKIPFIIGDLILLSVAALLAYRMGTDPTTAEVVGIVVSTGMAVAVGLAPFVIGYARDQDRMLRDRERLLERLVRETSSASDQASIAANGLNEIAERTKANLATLDALPESIKAAREAAEAKFTKSSKSTDLKPLTTELAAVRDELTTQSKALNARIDAAVASMEKSVQSLVPLIEAQASTPAPKPAEAKPKGRAKKAKAPAPIVEDSLFGGEPETAESPTTVEPSLAIADPSPPRKRKPRKSKAAIKAPEPSVPADPPPAEKPANPEVSESIPVAEAEAPAPKVEPAAEAPEVLLNSPPEATETDFEEPSNLEITPEPEPAESAPEPETEPPVPATVPAETEPIVLDEPAPEEPALSSDGMTRLTVTAYIGIGNRLFIRGDGPGLSREEGVPLQFVSIGKWRWETDGATAPVKATLWKNDEEECTSLGEVELAPGAQLETSANF